MNTQSVICSQERARAELDKTATKTEAAPGNIPDPWASLCDWLTSTFRGIEGSLERIEHDGSRVVEFQDRSLASLRAYVQANGVPAIGRYSSNGAAVLLGHTFDKDAIVKKRLPYEHLDQLTVDILLGVR